MPHTGERQSDPLRLRIRIRKLQGYRHSVPIRFMQPPYLQERIVACHLTHGFSCSGYEW
jgi:hypothetical protein